MWTKLAFVDLPKCVYWNQVLIGHLTFYASSESKTGFTKFMLLYMEQYFAQTLQVISFKNNVYFLHGRS